MGQGHYGVGPVFFESVSAVTATNSVQLGTRLLYDGNKYVYVYNAGTTQISVGEGATVSAVSGYSVTVSSITLADILMGVCKHVTLTTGTYGWLVCEGFAPAKAVPDTGLVAGGMLSLGADGRFAPALSTMTANVFGKCMIATISGGIGEAYFKAFVS